MLRAAVIGTGNISPMHINGYLAFPERCEIVALCDIAPEKCERAKETFGLPDARVFASHKALLDGAAFDLASICTPPYCHAEIAADCLKAGRHVIVEKPMAAALSECDQMMAAAAESGKILSVVAQNRFRDGIWNLKRVLDSGLIGKVVHAQVDSLWWRGHCYYDLWWRGLWEKEGGGCTLNHAVHHIDMLGWMMGRPSEVCAMISNAAHDNSEVEDVSVAVMRYGGGALAQVTSSVVHHGEEQQIIFQGEKARVSAPWRVAAQTSKPNGFPDPNPALEREIDAFFKAQPSLPYETHTGQIGNVLDAIESGGKPFIGGAEGRLTIELITAIYQSAAEGRTVRLPITPDDPFYTAEGILSRMPRFYQKTGAARELRGEITTGREWRKTL
ncbi:MAG: Gfo/Idh/MocA family oxidoreductase [Oscillospiraceae bacterium]|nr:Gfo/Idh/MocA family oxidoreductase [Oscillospiraceae bacterium]